MVRKLALLALLVPIAAIAQSGTLYLSLGQPGVYVAAPTVETTVNLRVRGLILRGEVTQRFRNPESTCAEAIYAFPLPENAAVDTLRMTVGERVIEGEIKERKEAEHVYQQAKSEGKRASLLNQDRPNLFTISIATIAAGEEVTVAIAYQQDIEYRDGAFRLRFPMAIGPRYMPNGAVPLTPALSRWERVPPPFHLTVDLDSGFSLRRVESTYYKIDTTVVSGSRYTVSLQDGVPADHDFELVWQPDLGSEPKSALFTEKEYALVMVMPPAVSRGNRLPKESIFIIDTSGSMGGPSIDEAKSALLMAIDHLDAQDRFNIIELLFSFIRSHLGRSRLFTVGIGSAPNSHFMRDAARFGRGTFTYIGSSNEMQEKMTALFEKLESPVLTNVELRFDDPAVEMWPQRIPDLYAGEPLVIAVKFSKPTGRVIASGKRAGEEWNDVHNMQVTAEESGIGRLWARRKIEALADSEGDVRQQIVDLALPHHLVSQYTSLVAVDHTPSGVPQQTCETRPVPATLPAGWGGIDGSLPGTATPAPMYLLVGIALLTVAAVFARLTPNT